MMTHLNCLSRLIWLGGAGFRVRLSAFVEYIRLSRLQKRIQTPGGLGAVLTDALAAPVLAQYRLDVDTVYLRLLDLSMALKVHPTAMCLARSIRVMQLLRRRGISAGARLRIGVRCAPVGFRGHAWVEHSSWPLLDLPVPDCMYDRIWEEDEILQAMVLPQSVHGSLRARHGVLIAQLADGESVMLDIVGGRCFSMNETGRQVWEEIAESGTFDSAIERIAAASGEAAMLVRKDVSELVEGLMSAGLVAA